MDTLSSMRMFARIAEEGSFTGAAQRMNMSTAATSRAIAALEAHLHTRLLHRSTRRVTLTEAGKRYPQRCEQILACIDVAEAEAADAQLRPSGQLRVHASTRLGQAYLVPAIVHYQQRYPAVSVDLTLSQHTPDLIDVPSRQYLNAKVKTFVEYIKAYVPRILESDARAVGS